MGDIDRLVDIVSTWALAQLLYQAQWLNEEKTNLHNGMAYMSKKKLIEQISKEFNITKR